MVIIVKKKILAKHKNKEQISPAYRPRYAHTIITYRTVNIIGRGQSRVLRRWEITVTKGGRNRGPGLDDECHVIGPWSSEGRII